MKGCTNRSGSGNAEILFHKFPDNKALQKAWPGRINPLELPLTHSCKALVKRSFQGLVGPYVSRQFQFQKCVRSISKKRIRFLIHNINFLHQPNTSTTGQVPVLKYTAIPNLVVNSVTTDSLQLPSHHQLAVD